jgi:hypothetical protein
MSRTVLNKGTTLPPLLVIWACETAEGLNMLNTYVGPGIKKPRQLGLPGSNRIRLGGLTEPVLAARAGRTAGLAGMAGLFHQTAMPSASFKNPM